MLLCTLLVSVIAGVLVQALRGYLHFELGSYLLWFVWPQFAGFAVLIAILAMFVQVLVPQKYIGWGVMLAWIVVTMTLNQLGFEHHLYTYGDAPDVPLSDMNGLGRFWIARTWFEVYWLAFATMLLVVMHGLWRRGTTVSLRARARQFRHRLHGRPLVVLCGAALVWVATGGWIFYNTNVLNTYTTQPQRDKLAADTEKTLLKFESVPQPRISDVTLDVQLYPEQARAITTGHYVLVNRGQAPISEIHLQWSERLRLDTVELAGASVKQEWPRFHYRIYKLATPLQPGEQRVLGFATTLEERGFRNDAPLTAIVANGSFMANTDITPSIGFSRRDLLKGRTKRREYELSAPRNCVRMATLEDDAARAQNVLSHDSDWVTADVTLTTDADQTPIAPGRTVSDTVSRASTALGSAHLGALPQRRADQPVLLDPVRALRRSPHGVALAQGRRRSRGLSRARPRVQRRSHARRDEGLARTLQREVLALPVRAGAHRRIPLRDLRGLVRQHDPLFGEHRLHPAADRSREDRHGHLRDGARDRPPVVGPPQLPADQQGAAMLTESLRRSTRRCS